MDTAVTYPIDTDDENDIFVIMRRVHWYVDDLISNHLHRRRISTSERRLLDALHFAHQRGVDSLSTSLICDLVPTLRPQTAASILERLYRRINRDSESDCGTSAAERASINGSDEGLVGVTIEGRTKRFHLTDHGRRIREAYCTEVERQLQVFYDSRSGRPSNPLLDRIPVALDYVNTYLAPSVDRLTDGDRPGIVPTTAWSGLRWVHLYISDSLYNLMRLDGVGPVERRVMDAIGYGRKHGLDGLNLGTICRLNDALTRPVAQSAVNRLVGWNWLNRIENDVREHTTGRVLWSLTPKGDRVRESYKRRTILLLREVLDPERTDGGELEGIVRAAHEHRDGRLLPGLDYLKSVV